MPKCMAINTHCKLVVRWRTMANHAGLAREKVLITRGQKNLPRTPVRFSRNKEQMDKLMSRTLVAFCVVKPGMIDVVPNSVGRPTVVCDSSHNPFPMLLGISAPCRFSTAEKSLCSLSG